MSSGKPCQSGMRWSDKRSSAQACNGVVLRAQAGPHTLHGGMFWSGDSGPVTGASAAVSAPKLRGSEVGAQGPGWVVIGTGNVLQADSHTQAGSAGAQHGTPRATGEGREVLSLASHFFRLVQPQGLCVRVGGSSGARASVKLSEGPAEFCLTLASGGWGWLASPAGPGAWQTWVKQSHLNLSQRKSPGQAGREKELG